MPNTSTENILKIRAAANKWISDNFPEHRKYITHAPPEYSQADKAWRVELTTRAINGKLASLGFLLISDHGSVVHTQDPAHISAELSRSLEPPAPPETVASGQLIGDHYRFLLGDGMEGAAGLENRSVELLLTDPPYGISNPYTCEKQVPRRLRKDGTDFIMPRGHFGNWDYEFEPEEWTRIVLPKVKGWAVIFCAQAQIGEYSKILKQQKFAAVGTLVWHKTNPVPFNHKYKPINAWEALVVGKRPGTKFNGHVVHNVFTCKSPSPQQRIHPTQKPLPLITRFVDLFSCEGDTVFDPFAGSATTVIASAGMDRKALAYERDSKFYDLAAARIRKELRNDEFVLKS